MEKLTKIRELWNESSINKTALATAYELSLFETNYELALPDDLANYFLFLNGTDGSYDKNLFRFYSFKEFLPIKNGLANWQGTPNYKNIVKSLPDHEKYFVFSDYSFHFSAFAIKLNKEIADNNVYIIHGSYYEKIANTFGEFMELYLKDSPSIYV